MTINYANECLSLVLVGISERELAISEFKPGPRLRVFFKQKTEMVNGRKVKVPIINRIDFLGRDEYTRLQEILDLPPSFPVTLVDSAKLPAGDPLKVYLSIAQPQIEKDFFAGSNSGNAPAHEFVIRHHGSKVTVRFHSPD